MGGCMPSFLGMVAVALCASFMCSVVTAQGAPRSIP